MAFVETERELEDAQAQALAAQGTRYINRRSHLRRIIRRSWLARIGVTIVVVVVFLTIFGPLIAPYPATEATPDVFQPPSADHWFGTDGGGLDVFSRVIVAPRYDVAIALAATVLSFSVGAIVGLLASYSRGVMGELALRTSDTIQAFPLLVLAVVLVVGAGRSIGTIVIVIAALNAPLFLRLIRSQVISLRERSFVEAARASGLTERTIAWRHVMPNAIPPAFPQASITMGFSILIAAGLSFLGAGVQPPTPEWGAMIASGAQEVINGIWWTSLFPGLAMALAVFGFAVVADVLENVLLRRT
jgi:peptide/nickel transport system permease protein